ncbi:PTS glucose transporter subunit IIA [Bacillus sp. BRMEA1]|uniref:PTS sugar transporter subunit IIA n=1 Tax=Neobacillus endophyticus TaxID=2738405 RepID=UPI001564B74F|nr:PTS glucose transporter subunit IIA [Neobacillus endophyticus]NRD77768.1 PTS glucose transporter subunit IIA [Neobacillus endophyticus]
MKFNFFKKTKDLHIFVPVNGEIIPIEEVPDPVFNQKMMGVGAAVVPDHGDIVAPVDGTIIQVAPTKHAVGILAEDGTEILIHVGLDTVALNGEGFQTAVKEGDKVAVGQTLLKVNWDFLKEHVPSIITPIVITNSQDSGKKYSFATDQNGIAGKTVMITVQ